MIRPSCSLVDRELTPPGPGEVRVRVVVSGVNPTDWKSRRGSGPGESLPFAEVTPNQDGAGVIDAVGEGVTDLAVGDRVWIYLAGHERPTGTAQEYTNLPAERVVRLPDGIGFDIGASLGVPAMTAHRALTVAEDGPRRLQPGALEGKFVLVAGGAGAVGHAAIQLARWAGATVITTISGPAKADLVTAAGAHHVINYRDQDAAAAIAEIAPDGVDLIVEVAIAANAPLDVQVAKSRTSVAIYANDGGDEFSLDIRASMVKNIRYQFVLLYTVGEPGADPSRGGRDPGSRGRCPARRGGRRAAVAPVCPGRRGCRPSGRRGRCGRQGPDRRRARLTKGSKMS